jgi:hypothetical protein
MNTDPERPRQEQPAPRPVWTVRYRLGRGPEERRFCTLAAALAWADFHLFGRECDILDGAGKSLWNYAADEAAALALTGGATS